MSSLHSQKLLKPTDAAEFLDLSASTLAKRCITGDGPRFIKFGGAVRYDLKDLQEFVAQSARRSTSDQGGGAR
jgi:predicted DNA-binding transcriptional regulator AlpA